MRGDIRKVVGVLIGYDWILNLLLDDAYEEKQSGQRIPLGSTLVRGNSVIMIEVLDKIQDN